MCALAETGDQSRAEDAVQEAFLQAWLHLPRLQTPAAFRAWLRRIVVNLCRRDARRHGAAEMPLESAHSLHAAYVDPFSGDALQARVVQNAVAALPPGEQAVVRLFYEEQHTREETAVLLGVSPVVVKKRLASARAKLRENLIEINETNQPNLVTEALIARILAFTQLFSALINKGESLTASLNTLGENAADLNLRAVAQNVSRDVQAGDLLSRSLRRHGQFPEHFLSAIREGEASGALEVVMNGLADGTYQTGNVRMLTVNAENARFRAFEIAQQHRHNEVTPEHLLAALLEQTSSGAIRELTQSGMDLTMLRAAIQDILNALPMQEGETRYTDALRAVRLCAFVAAEQEGTNLVGTRHLLLALRDENGPATVLGVGLV